MMDWDTMAASTPSETGEEGDVTEWDAAAVRYAELLAIKKETDAELKQVKDSLLAEMPNTFGTHGKITMKTAVRVTWPEKFTWDSDKIAAIVGDDDSKFPFVRTQRSIPRASYEALSLNDQEMVEDALTISLGTAKITVEIKDRDIETT